MSGYSIQVGQLPGTGTNDAANAGNVGEILTNSTNLTAVTTNTNINLAQITLTPGDWDVTGTVIGAATNASTNVTVLTGSLSTTSATHSFTTGDFVALQYGAGSVTGNNAAIAISAPVKSFNVPAGTTTVVYLIGSMAFTVSTAGMKGNLRALRVR